eukprot:scaffold8505_cov130-Cylindrotheca_fusiformis.AAC.17
MHPGCVDGYKSFVAYDRLETPVLRLTRLLIVSQQQVASFTAGSTALQTQFHRHFRTGRLWVGNRPFLRSIYPRVSQVFGCNMTDAAKSSSETGKEKAEGEVISNDVSQSQEPEGRPKRKRRSLVNGVAVVPASLLPRRNPSRKKSKSTKQEGKADVVEASGPQAVPPPRNVSKGSRIENMKGDSATPCPPPTKSVPLHKDPHKFYVEEEAHLYHNPPLPSEFKDGVAPQDLKQIPPPPPFKPLPNTGKCKWSFDEFHRVLLADFSASAATNGDFKMDPVDEMFLLETMERDDITVISEGLISFSSLNPEWWTMDYLKRVLGEEYYHKFRRFDTVVDSDGLENCVEVDGMYSMKVSQYIRYLEKRQEVMTGKGNKDPYFSFIDHDEKSHEIDAVKSALYMIDFDVNRLLPNMYSNFLKSFRLPEVLPGGTHCMMNSVTPTARPFMGPNLYVTPPAAFTHFHQDGHGTVDSGHLCLSGYNEVVMLRRLTERHKKHALMILTGDLDEALDDCAPSFFDGLYQEPHADKLGEKPQWPTVARIEECRQMGYCPSLCIVKPGQLIHINKGRLHAFRKMSASVLPDDDCHKELRQSTIDEHDLSGEQLCISLAWDWMYRGKSAAGINREICTALEAATLNRKMRRLSLGIPEFSLFQMARIFPPLQTSVSTELNKLIRCDRSAQQASTSADTSDAIIVCQGILPSLRHVIENEAQAFNDAEEKASNSRQRGERVTIAKRPNRHENTQFFPMDPYSCDGFACKLCSKELSNVYYHCDGCENLLSKDFNICQDCHKEKLFMRMLQMHPDNPKRHSTLNHTGNFHLDRTSRCPCKNGPACKFCHYCSGCSCRCHTWFTLHFRLFGREESEDLLKRVQEVVASSSSEQDKYLDNQAYLKERLDLAER